MVTGVNKPDTGHVGEIARPQRAMSLAARDDVTANGYNSDGAVADMRILIVDDQEMDLHLLRGALHRAGFTDVATVAEPLRVPALFAERLPDLLILDLHMPGIGGFALMEKLAPLTGHGTCLPILVITADAEHQARRRALSLGARDFLTKPIEATELRLRVRNLLQVHHLQHELRRHNERLESNVAERTRDLSTARLEILDRLAAVAEYRDDDTHQHTERVGRTAALIARELGLPDKTVALIRRAAPLHDIGKVGIPDEILLKPGRLTDTEFEYMQLHAAIGAEILSGSQSRVLQLAEIVALTHHERWDGDGYPQGLSRCETPIAGRIAAVADVYDALTHPRPYKPAWPVQQAASEIAEGAGAQFDADVVRAFKRIDHERLLDPVSDCGFVPAVGGISAIGAR
jgi:putative two-component system response regulator